MMKLDGEIHIKHGRDEICVHALGDVEVNAKLILSLTLKKLIWVWTGIFLLRIGASDRSF
jgi:hypothetical protein